MPTAWKLILILIKFLSCNNLLTTNRLLEDMKHKNIVEVIGHFRQKIKHEEGKDQASAPGSQSHGIPFPLPNFEIDFSELEDWNLFFLNLVLGFFCRPLVGTDE